MASLRGSRIFLDTCISFNCSERPETKKVLLRATRSGCKFLTSITVLGEYVQECVPDRTEMLNVLPELISKFDIGIVRPDSRLRYCCLAIDKVMENKVSYGTDYSDKTHVAYAVRNGCNYLLTMDRALQGIRDLQKCSLFDDCNERETRNTTNCFPTIRALTVDDLDKMVQKH